MTSRNGQECKNCIFFTDDGMEGEDVGECHRYPPKMAMTKRQETLANDIENTWVGLYPEVFVGGWCGEWQKKVD